MSTKEWNRRGGANYVKAQERNRVLNVVGVMERSLWEEGGGGEIKRKQVKFKINLIRFSFSPKIIIPSRNITVEKIMHPKGSKFKGDYFRFSLKVKILVQL